MIECRELEPLLTPYVDGEAAEAVRSRVEAHAEACKDCRNRLAAERAAREAVCARRDMVRGRAPEALKARCAAYANSAGTVPRATATAPPARQAVPIYRRWMPVTAAATIFLAIAAVVGLGLNDKAHALAFQATVDHMKCSRFNIGSGAIDPAEVSAQWQSRFSWPLRVPASSNEEGIELRALRRCAVTDGRVAHLMYIWQGEPLSVYILPASVVGESSALIERFGHQSVIWSQNDRTYMVVANRKFDPALERVVSYVRANAY